MCVMKLYFLRIITNADTKHDIPEFVGFYTPTYKSSESIKQSIDKYNYIICE